MTLRLKKIIFAFLCNGITGFLISNLFNERIPDLRWPKFKFVVGRGLTHYRYVASIFWGFYESAEIRMVEKYLDGSTDVIELGSSLGVVSSHISSKLASGKKLICVEANPNLISNIKLNVTRHLTEKAFFFIESSAINYEKHDVKILLTDNNTETKIQTNMLKGPNVISIPATTIGQLKKKYDVDGYSLVCDIEGSEVDILFNDAEALNSCRQLIIELHDASYRGKSYPVSAVAELFVLNGFKLVDQEGPVYCFRRA